MSSTENGEPDALQLPTSTIINTRAYQQELLEESLHRNIVIALDTGSGKTHIAVLRMKHEAEREPQKVRAFAADCHPCLTWWLGLLVHRSDSRACRTTV